MLSDESVLFSYITESVSCESPLSSTINRNSVKHPSSFSFVKYLCYRTGRSLLFPVEYREKGKVKSLKIYLEKLTKHELIFFVPFTGRKFVYPHIKRILTLEDDVPPLVCCQDFSLPLNLNDISLSASFLEGRTIVNIIVATKDGSFTMGHVPFITPSFSSVDLVFQYMFYMMWLSNDEIQYIKNLPICICTSYKGGLSLLATKGNREEIAIIYPALGIGEIVIARQLVENGAIEYAQGIICRKYMSQGILVYDISTGSGSKSWKGISCIHVRRR